MMARTPDDQDFWTRRRAAVRAEAEAEDAARAAADAAAEQEALVAARKGKSDAEILDELGLPDPDTLGRGDDFKVFLGAAVPERIRRRALRRLWRSNPVLANLDGLVDHGEDYTDTATVRRGMGTAYQVGRGMIRRAAELAEAPPASEGMPEPDAAASHETTADIADQQDGETTPEPVRSEPEERAPAAPCRRHMRFSFAT